MKVLFLTHYCGLYGANISLIRLVNGLKSHGVQGEVLLPAFGGELEARLIKNNIPCSLFKSDLFDDDYLFNRSWIKRWIGLLLLRRQIKSFCPDVIYTNSSVMSVGAWVADSLGIPHVWHIREYREVHLNNLNDNYFCRQLKKSHAIIAVSNDVANHPLYQVGKRIHTIYNGVFLKNEPIRREQTVTGNAVTFCIVGVLTGRHSRLYHKRQDMAIEAFAQVNKSFPDTHLLIAGDGSDEAKTALKRLARDLGVEDRVQFLGYVNDIQSVYEKSDVLLSCAKKEALGNTPIEAMRTGLPVIAYNAGGIVETVVPQSGFLYNDASELLEKMTFFVKHPDKILEMGRNAQKRVAGYTIENYASQIYKILCDVTGERT